VGYVNDFANVIAPDAEARLVSLAERLNAATRGDMVVVTLPDLGGRPVEEVALRLGRDPGKFLSTVQIGITLVGIVAGALGSGTVAGNLAEFLGVIPLIGEYAKPISLVLVIGVLTYLSLVIGELVPKRF
jgi:CBS domain containing-hemolysin-like protein